ncbi:type VI secretion system baseplate subunit TssE [Photorhabdus laumondii subsp. laumondii]|uniref:Photorhabdus luminescens subsp. laumondii TTO1 complete genome segment 11/17 n=3 Tax=Photorhabdus laumondii TaxID=2218628 RepID=Q7N269_PHOLL|nr:MULTISPECIES: type VI secretion system baseplate subunit TssE [Photorhabdus]PQQ38541.1 type VI secretion system baseplate subunit TssE [Photorhabdus luminescens]AWK42915.1 type VI secretion system lysozyme-like protein [Photorhabdus laumondii subsp. laumondii]AXG43689.1 type VI secretion system baseplate subunit TssE [Photorhabdus laumondii subsp. laumondii]AXG48234.1 type VI secretion system baseplate subunit TssE [Photorhabdus laumondii subsp. laumondii]MCC8385797.1 type VI secretion syst
MKKPSLYESLFGNFNCGLELHQVSEEEQVILSVLDNMQRILNSRAGSLTHLPDYGLPDLNTILRGLPTSSQRLISTIEHTLLTYEPRLKRVDITLLPELAPGHLRYDINAELKGVGLVRFSTEFVPEGNVLIRHLRQQGYVD